MDRRHFLILGLLAGFFVGYGVSELLIAGIPLPSSGEDLAKPLTGAEAVKYKEECRALDLSTSREDPYASKVRRSGLREQCIKRGNHTVSNHRKPSLPSRSTPHQTTYS